MICYEIYPDGLPRDMIAIVSNRALSKSILSSNKTKTISNLEDSTRKIWQLFLLDYSQRQLTRHTDKLIAISAIAKEVRNILKDEYIAGLWEDALPSELLWQNLRGHGLACKGNPDGAWARLKKSSSLSPALKSPYKLQTQRAK